MSEHGTQICDDGTQAKDLSPPEARAVFDGMARLFKEKPDTPHHVDVNGWRLSVTKRARENRHASGQVLAEHLATGDRFFSMARLSKRLKLGSSIQPQPSHDGSTHVGYAGAILQGPSDGMRLLEGTRVAIYFAAPHNDWFEGSISSTAVVGRRTSLAFDDGSICMQICAASYGRYNMWVLTDGSHPDERWIADGHALLGRHCTSEGVRGLLRLWCEARRTFSMSVRSTDNEAMESEILVHEEDVALCDELGSSSAVGQDGSLASDSATAISTSHQLLLPPVPLERVTPILSNLRETIIDPKAGTSVSHKEPCRHHTISQLLGLKPSQYWHFLDYATRGHLPERGGNASIYFDALVALAQVSGCVPAWMCEWAWASCPGGTRTGEWMRACVDVRVWAWACSVEMVRVSAACGAVPTPCYTCPSPQSDHSLVALTRSSRRSC